MAQYEIDSTKADTHDTGAFAAFCNVGECTWASPWHHIDPIPGKTEDEAQDAAYDAADADGKAHVEDVHES